MCGIGGVVRVWPASERDRALATPHVHSIPEAWLDILDDSIKHRGPDGQGRFRDRALRADGCVVDVAFVHRRLSIIDHAGGHQPMLSLGKGQGVVTGVKRYALGDGLGLYERDAASELGALSASEGLPQRTPSVSERVSSLPQPPDRVCVIFNGCIYNHRELRAELQKAGHVFSTDHSDTEVLVHGWRERGENLFARLDGMFALAVWDRSLAELILARDIAGEKPLYECQPSERLYAFASTHAALLRWHALISTSERDTAPLPLHVSEQGLASWVRTGGSILPITPPIDEIDPRVCSRFALHDRGDGVMANFASRSWFEDLPRRAEDMRIELADIDVSLRDAVRSRLDADVSRGIFLSGGVDSSLIARFAADSVGKTSTFTVRMPDARYDESEHAEMVARHLHTDHHTLDCDARISEQLPALLASIGLPFGDSSLLPSYWVSRAAAQHVKVAIGGDGGDELFAGYERHVANNILESPLGELLRLMPQVTASSSHPKSLRSKFARLSSAARTSYDEIASVFPSRELLMLAPCASKVQRPVTAVPDAPRFDFDWFLPGDLLRKSDTASMAVPLELRSPFLSREMIRLGLSIPLRILMPHNQRKGLLRQVARKYLPAEIVDRPKMGFAIPIGEWFRSDYGGLRTMLLDHLSSSEPFGSPSLGINLNMKFVRQMLDEHLGTGPSGRVVRDHSQRLYMLLVLSIWAKWLSGLSRRV